MYKNKKILILGGAKSGFSVAKLLAPDNEVILTDKNKLSGNNTEILNDLNVKVIITDNQGELLDESFDYVIKNPGISMDHPVCVKASILNIQVINEMEVAFSFIPKGVTVVGITGSNGKTTTTTIVYEILKKSNDNVVLGGNIGIPLCDIVNDLNSDSILILEISDHQLLNMYNFKTSISLITNLCPTHLDFHGTYESYKKCKKKIFNNHTEENIAIVDKNSDEVTSLIKDISSEIKYFNDSKNYVGKNGIFVNNELIVELSDILVVGEHNYQNILCALMIINEIGIDKKAVKEFLEDFKGVEHRIEYVTKVNDVRYFNDSKSTNPTSTITALRTFTDPIHLILGGMERSQDFNELNNDLGNIKCIYAIGETTERIKDYASKLNVKCVECYTLDKAINEIKNNSELSANDIVLLSPGSASWDQYKKFEDRGNEFKDLI